MGYGIYRLDNGELVEGGFFSRDAAEKSCADYNDQESVGVNTYEVRKQAPGQRRHATREEQRARYIDCGPRAWDDEGGMP
jgi:hypothetical protein